nr:iron ABC transporter permease [uncultured Paracoccus sp.]
MTDAVFLPDQMRGDYRRASRSRQIWLVGAPVLLACLMVLDLSFGPSGLPLRNVMRGIWAGPDGEDRTIAAILWQLRMPQTFMGVLVGACLGMAGLMMQTILNNPLASPFMLGFSAAAGFGAALAIMFGGAIALPAWAIVPTSAFAMTLAACGLIYLLARRRGSVPEILVLGGIAVLFFFQAIQSLLQYMAAPEVLQQIVFWLFGSMLKTSWTSVLVCGVILLACLPFVIRDTWALTTLRLGDGNARSLGLRVDALRRRSFVVVALLTAAAVSFVGTVGFVGLIAPRAAWWARITASPCRWRR